MRHSIIRWLLLFNLVGAFAIESRGAEPSKSASANIRTIYLIRHGAYDMTEQKGDESTAYGLVPLGIAQARLIGSRLRGMPVTFDSLVSSTYTRARQTADVINQSFPQLTHETTRLLCECLPPTRIPQNRADATPENHAAAVKQLDAAFAHYFVPAIDHDRHDILVCHGNVIRYFTMKALGVDPQAWLGLTVAHCSLTIIQVSSSGTFKVLAVGDTGHIPPNLLSGISRGPDPQLVVP